MARGPVARALSDGTDPDPRFTLANERTFLAWLRTALGLVAAGVAVEAFASDVLPPPARSLISAVLLVLGAATAVESFRRWLATERSLRRDEPLSPPPLAIVLAAGVAVTAVAVLAVVLAVG